MPQLEPPPGFLARLFRAVAVGIVCLGGSVALALWNARETVAQQGYAELGFERSIHLAYLDAAWAGWARGLRIAPPVALGCLVVLLVVWLIPGLRPTRENLREAARGQGRAFLVFAAGLVLMVLLALHLIERQTTRGDAWLGPDDVFAASIAFVAAYLGIWLASLRARDGADARVVSSILWGTALFAFGGYWINRGLWSPPRDTYVALRNLLLAGGSMFLAVLLRSDWVCGLPRRLWRPVVALALIAASLPVVLRGMTDGRGAPTIAAGNPWNVLVIGLDTVRADVTSLADKPRRGQERTPALRALADRGVNFRGAIAQAPWTLPSFASILTGKYPQQHGAYTLDSKLRDRELMLPEILREAGYETFGVVSHLYLEQYRGMGQGYQRWDESQALGHEAVTSVQVTERAQRMLEQADRSKPFFMFAHYFDPHWEYVNHKGWSYAGDYDGWLKDQLDLENLHKNRHLLDEEDLAHLSRLYQEEVSYTDRHIGRLLQYLDESGLAENTLVIVVSDHGEEFMEHGGLDHTTTVFQELVHVPLAIVPPGDLAAGMIVDGTVETRRIFGTVLELLDIDVPALTAAREQSLLTRLDDGAFVAHPAPAYTSVWLEHSHPRWGKRFKIAALVNDDWKFINDLTRGKEMLFHLASDPGETRQVNGKHADKTQTMRAQLHAWIKAMQEAAAGGTVSAEADAEALRLLEQLGYAGSEDDDLEDEGKEPE